MEGLADEVVMVVLSHLPQLHDVASFGLVCWRFDRLRHDAHLWRTLLERHLGVNSFRCPPGEGVDWEAKLRDKTSRLRSCPDMLAQLLAAAEEGCHVLLARRLADHNIARSTALAHTRTVYVAELGTNVENGFSDQGLTSACSGGSLEAAQIFLERGAMCHTYTPGPLLEAVRWNHRQLIELLLDRGAKVSYRYVGGRQSIEEAAALGKEDAMAALLARHIPVLRLLLAHYQQHLEIMADANEALELAIHERDVEITKFFIENGVKPVYWHLQVLLNTYVDPPDELLVMMGHLAAGSSERVYHLFTSMCAKYGNLKVCQYLVNKGADINSVRLDRWNDRGFTPLHTAVRDGNVVMAECLLNAGALPDGVINGTPSPRAFVQEQSEHLPAEVVASLGELFARFPPLKA